MSNAIPQNLTLKQYYAGLAMQSLILTKEQQELSVSLANIDPAEILAKGAVIIAEALCKELDKTEEEEA